jgi:Leucine-rich repeat (LRR) protein
MRLHASRASRVLCRPTLHSLCEQLSNLVEWENSNECAFTGTLVTELGLLTKLQQLKTTGSALRGTIPDEMYNMTSLMYLGLSGGTLLEGSLSTAIGKLSSLQKLYLTDENLTGTIPTEIGLLTRLQDLALGNNVSDIRRLNRAVAPATCLQCSVCCLKQDLQGTVPTEIGRMTSLIVADFSKNTLTGQVPATITNCFSLQSLYLHENQFNGTLPDMNLLPALRSFTVYNNNFDSPNSN